MTIYNSYCVLVGFKSSTVIFMYAHATALQYPVLRVPLDRVTFVCHDPDDASVFAVIVKSEETVTKTGLKLYAFQSDQKTVRLYTCNSMVI